MSQNKDVNYGHKMKYKPENDTYVVGLRKKRFRWWWLLLLLPLLLFIRCSHDITVTAVDAESGMTIESLPVQSGYTSHFLYKDKQFFADIPVNRCDTTDSVGQAHFRDMPCSVYSYIFYCLSKIEFRAVSECHGPDTLLCNFHYTRNATMECRPAKATAHITVLDLETDEPLAGARVRVAYTNASGDTAGISGETDAAGRLELPGFNRCAVTDSIHGSCYGYADTCRTEVEVRDMLEPDKFRLRLRPLKESFTFFVKDVETREPIPGAKAEVTVTSAGAVLRGSSVTNVDGKGRGEFREAFILAKVDIHASKAHYNDSVLAGDYTVEEFVKQPDDNRTVWLRPEPYVENFRNVDSISGDPLPGVKNEITVTDPAGNVSAYTEISNRSGHFSVKAKAGSKIHIRSTNMPSHKDKTTDIPSFSKGEDIPMAPNIIDCAVDIVMCIDNTGSMKGCIDMVKANALNFGQDLSDYCRKNLRNVKHLRLKVITYGDFEDSRMSQSPMFEMPGQKGAFQSYVQSLGMTHGGDEPENGLEALATAIKDTPWQKSDLRTRHIIVVYTDASTHPLGWRSPSFPYQMNYPSGMPSSLGELKGMWDRMNADARRLVLFAPSAQSWITINSTWSNVSMESGSLSSVLSGSGYNEVLRAICKSL